MEAGNRSSLIHTSGSSSSTHSRFWLTLHFLGPLLLPWAGSVYKDSAAQCGWHSQGPGSTRCPGRVSSACYGQEVQIQVFGRGGAHGCAPAGATQLPAGYSPCSTRVKGAQETKWGPCTDDGNLLSSVPDPGSLQCPKGRQCYVWEGQHFQSRIWCNGNYPKLFLLASSKTSSQLLHSCVNPLVYPHGVSWTISKLQGLGDA